MRTSWLLVLSLFAATPALAADVAVPVQGVLADADGVRIDGEREITFRLYDDPTSTSVLWETTLTVDFDDGRFTVYLGEQDTLSSGLFRLDQSLYLTFQVSGDDEMQRFPLGWSPLSAFAAHAGDAETLDGLGSADFLGAGYTPDWTDITNRPAGLDDGDDVGDIPFGDGLTDTGGELAVDTVWLGQQVLPLCYDTVDELTDALAGVYLEAGYVPPWAAISGIPADLADGDDDTTYTAGLGLLLDSGAFSIDEAVVASLLADDFLDTAYVPAWGDITDVPPELLDGDDDTTYIPGFGLALTGSTFSVDLTALGLEARFRSLDTGVPFEDLTNVPIDLLDGDDLRDAGFGLLIDDDGSLIVDVVTLDGLYLPAGYVPDWDEVSSIPADLLDGDDDTTYAAGVGLQLAGGTFGIVDGFITDQCFDTKAELLSALSGEFLSASYTPSWNDLTDVPGFLADGDDDTTYTAGTGLGLAGTTFNVLPAFVKNQCFDTVGELTAALGTTYLPSDYTPAWDELTGVPTDLLDGDDLGPAYVWGFGLSETDGKVEVDTSALESAFLPSSYRPDWGDLTSIPSDLADGDDLLSDTDVVGIVEGATLDLDAKTTFGGKVPVFDRYTDAEALAAVGRNLDDLLGWPADPLVQFGIAEVGCRFVVQGEVTSSATGMTRFPRSFPADTRPVVAATTDLSLELSVLGYLNGTPGVEVMTADADRFGYRCGAKAGAVHWVAVEPGRWVVDGKTVIAGTVSDPLTGVTFPNGAFTNPPVVFMDKGSPQSLPAVGGFLTSSTLLGGSYIAFEPGVYRVGRYTFEVGSVTPTVQGAAIPFSATFGAAPSVVVQTYLDIGGIPSVTMDAVDSKGFSLDMGQALRSFGFIATEETRR